MRQFWRGALVLALAVTAAGGLAGAQSRLPSLPGYARWAEMAPQIPSSVVSGAISPAWAADGRSFIYTHAGKEWRYDVRRKRAVVIRNSAPAHHEPSSASGAKSDAPLVLARGRGADASVLSPDGTRRAFTRLNNVFVASVAGGNEVQLSRDGGEANRIRNGVGSYVYLEEFNVRSPVWWSPDGSKLAWMRYDETQVDAYRLKLDQTRTFSTILEQAYPHAGRPNPIADLMVHDFATGRTTRMDVREGQPFSDAVVGHYVWGAQWSADSSRILTRRADRLQKVYDLAACDALSGACRSVARESRPQSWAAGDGPRFLADGERFIWTTERDGRRNFVLRNLAGEELAVVEVMRIDEAAGWVWYTARTGDTPLKVQLHRVRLDGTGEERLTDPSLHHTVSISPDGRHFVDTAQAHDAPPTSWLMNSNGERIAQVVGSDTTRFDALGLKRTERFEFLSADGATRLYGTIDYPSDFDPSRRHPVLFSVYGGPGSSDVNETFDPPNPLTEFGFLVVKLEARTSAGRDRTALDQIYQRLGEAEVDDFAAGLRALKARPYVDGERIGVFGTSYGGFVAAMLMLRYPDLVQAGVANSPVADFRLYDSAYTERFLGLPQQHPEAYARASLLPIADQLEGDLMIYYGTSDDNVHPKHALQFIKALQAAGKSFEVQVGPDKGHTSVNQLRMMEFFIERLKVMRPDGSSPLASQAG
jgi:dipeptidyl-peptidase 4